VTDERSIFITLRLYLGETLDKLQWCRDNSIRREVPAKLQEAHIALSAIATAIELDMDGRGEEAMNALRLADWRPSWLLPPWGAEEDPNLH
jgi:hypothetical protein